MVLLCLGTLCLLIFREWRAWPETFRKMAEANAPLSADDAPAAVTRNKLPALGQLGDPYGERTSTNCVPVRRREGADQAHTPERPEVLQFKLQPRMEALELPQPLGKRLDS